MTKEKNIEYMKSYEKLLDRNIKKVDDDKIRLDMRQLKDKDDLKEVEAIIRDLEKNNGT